MTSVRSKPRCARSGKSLRAPYSVDLARRELKGCWVRSELSQKYTEMQLYSDTGFVEAALKRAARRMELLVAGARTANFLRRISLAKDGPKTSWAARFLHSIPNET